MDSLAPLARPSRAFTPRCGTRFAFEEFPQDGIAAFGGKPPIKRMRRSAETPLRMKSVGEAMAIGRTFKESLQKCVTSSLTLALSSRREISRRTSSVCSTRIRQSPTHHISRNRRTILLLPGEGGDEGER